MIVREWEEYSFGPEERLPSRRHVTLNRRGLLLVNRNVFDDLGRPARVVLLYDRRSQAMGVRAVGDREDIRPFTFKSYRTHSHRELNAYAFCRHYNIVPTETVRFTHPTIDHNGILTLDFHKTEPVTRASRK